MVQIIERGIEPYEISYAAMREFTDAREPDTSDQLWLVEHPPVYTLGLGADAGHVLDAHSIPVVQTDRGGEVTYHGPGQAVAYLLLDLRKPGRKLLPREFVQGIEQAVIDVLAAYNLRGERKPGAPGIYVAADDAADNLAAAGNGPKGGVSAAGDAPVDKTSQADWRGAKIAALGLKIRASGCTYHGVALNVAMDLRPFGWINPCGYPGLATVDMKTLGVSAPLDEVRQRLATALIARTTTQIPDRLPATRRL